MSLVLYSNVDVFVNEYRKEFLINPRGERFNLTPLEERSMVFENATITRNDEGMLEIEGVKTLLNQYKERGKNYERMVSYHPADLIKRHSFLGIVWFSVNGSMSRKVRSRYCCRHKEMAFIEREEVLSHSIQEK
ncbi:hypothetical protein [Sulfuricurvum sp.]|uniref:hypothetical protein n=1 Tax=Sulfuricurvum sp. TaxID=2025608 RepID=UPI0026025D70|nr:hypothetical protein [Sulfuricurvum sp.]MDD3597657.1 hypothetical protein [Sulfuricurvum sp.]